jgi:hypothetical protein
MISIKSTKRLSRKPLSKALILTKWINSKGRCLGTLRAKLPANSSLLLEANIKDQEVHLEKSALFMGVETLPPCNNQTRDNRSFLLKVAMTRAINCMRYKKERNILPPSQSGQPL